VGLEIAAQAAEHGVAQADVLVCCGGGGLTSGIAMALEARAPGLRARPVEPEGFDDTARSLAAGHVVRNATPSGSICDAIVTPEPGKITFPIMQRLCGPGIAVPDEDCLRAMAAAFQRLKIVAEPGGAVALAAALWHGESLRGDAVIAVVSGGNVDADMFCAALSRYA
jgi:threonine dehydratase